MIDLPSLGLDTEDAYPYTGKDGDCVFDETTVGATVGGVVNITFQDEDELKTAVGTVGPVSIAYDCTYGFEFYSSGVYSSTFCSDSQKRVNHAVLAVGYDHDEESGKDFWIVKNSWSSTWGLDGYFWIERGTYFHHDPFDTSASPRV